MSHRGSIWWFAIFLVGFGCSDADGDGKATSCTTTANCPARQYCSDGSCAACTSCAFCEALPNAVSVCTSYTQEAICFIDPMESCFVTCVDDDGRPFATCRAECAVVSAPLCYSLCRSSDPSVCFARCGDLPCARQLCWQQCRREGQDFASCLALCGVDDFACTDCDDARTSRAQCTATCEADSVGDCSGMCG